MARHQVFEPITQVFAGYGICQQSAELEERLFVWMVGEMLGVRNHRRFVLGA